MLIWEIELVLINVKLSNTDILVHSIDVSLKIDDCCNSEYQALCDSALSELVILLKLRFNKGAVMFPSRSYLPLKCTF